MQLEEPPKLRATRQSDICEKCEEELAGGEEPPQEHKELFRAARVLLDNGFENEDEIVPTLVFAANVGQMPRLEHIRDELAKAGGDSKARNELDAQLYSISGGWVWSSGRVLDGVPLVRRAALWINGVEDEGDLRVRRTITRLVIAEHARLAKLASGEGGDLIEKACLAVTFDQYDVLGEEHREYIGRSWAEHMREWGPIDWGIATGNLSPPPGWK